MMNLVSIVVPCYNSGKWIKRCVNSLLLQTYNNIEILLINDGSTDNTLNILNDLKYTDNRIFVFSQKNSGAGEARNLGIKKAKGKYITFVDSDDELESDAINVIISTLDGNTDIVISGMKYINNVGKYLYSNIPAQKNSYWIELKYNGTAFKLYKTNFLLGNEIFFGKYKIHEDLLFSVKACSSTNNIKILSQDKYLVHQDNDNSLTNSVKKNTLDKQIISDLLVNILNIIDIKKYGKLMVKFFLLKTLIQDVLIYKSNKETIKIYLDNYEYIEHELGKIKFYYQSGETLLINFIVNVFILFSKLNMINLLLYLK